MDDLEQGQILATSAGNVVRAWGELYPMLETLWEKLISGFDDVGDIMDGGHDKTWRDHWVYCSYGWQASVIEKVEYVPGQRGRKRRPKRLGTVSLHIRLCTDSDAEFSETDWPWLDQACLIVAWHEDKQNYGTKPVYWEASHFDPTRENVEAIWFQGHGLWEWGEGGAYFFALPVFSMKSEEDLDRKVIAPLKALFGKEDKPALAATALAGTGALMPYPDKRLPT